MFFAQDLTHQEYPFEFTPNEIEELLSLFQSPISNPNSGSDESNQTVYPVNDKKRRRMLSNRESARRSRMKKKRHLENLTEEVNRLSTLNQELKNRLGLIQKQCNLVCRENQGLRIESVGLCGRLKDLCHVLVSMHALQQHHQHQEVLKTRTNNYH